MKNLIRIGFLAALICLQSCGGGAIKNKDDDKDRTSAVSAKSKIAAPFATDNLVIKDEKDLTGYWAGTFEAGVMDGDTLQSLEDPEEYNMITITIENAGNGKVKGYVVMDGSVKPFDGDMRDAGNGYKFTFRGPGEDKHEGKFELSAVKGDTAMNGTWVGNRKKFPYMYTLTKRLFKYNPHWKLDASHYVDYNKKKEETSKTDDGDEYKQTKYFITSDDVDKYNASADILTKEEVANLKKADILIMRNSIFARHGYTFKKPLLNTYFSQQSWYVPISTDVTSLLTATEKKNLELLMRYEKIPKNIMIRSDVK